jgi:uncharacterized protein (DUF58 family)
MSAPARTRRVDWNRLNYILIPKRKEDLERLRASRVGRFANRMFRSWGTLSDEGRTLLVLTLLVGAFGVDVRRTSIYVLFSVLTGLLVGSIVAARGLRLRGATILTSAPRRVTVKQPVTFTVTCLGAPGSLRVRGPFLSWDGTWLERAPQETPVDEDGRAVATMTARFSARGEHHLDGFTAGQLAPFGLACGPRIESEAVKVVVVPRIANVQKLPLVVAARHQPGGVALASKSGESRDLHGVRPYRRGDPVRDLHARSWARAGYPVVREYQQEYFTRVGVVLDTDIADEDRLEAAIELAAGVVANLSHGEALVDVLVVGDRVHELTLGRSLGYLDQALDLLATVERGPALSPDAVTRRLEPYLERLSSVVVIGASRDDLALLEKTIESRGPRCATILVDDATAKAIANGEALSW